MGLENAVKNGGESDNTKIAAPSESEQEPQSSSSASERAETSKLAAGEGVPRVKRRPG